MRSGAIPYVIRSRELPHGGRNGAAEAKSRFKPSRLPPVRKPDA